MQNTTISKMSSMPERGKKKKNDTLIVKLICNKSRDHDGPLHKNMDT